MSYSKFALVLVGGGLLAACGENPVETTEATVAPFSARIEGDLNLSMTAAGYNYDYNASASGDELEIVLYSISADQERRDERSLVRIEIPFDIEQDLAEGVEYEFHSGGDQSFRGQLSYSFRNPSTDSVLRSRYEAQTMTILLHRPNMPSGAKNRLVGSFTIVAPRVFEEREVSGNVIPSETDGEHVVVRGEFDIKVYQSR